MAALRTFLTHVWQFPSAGQAGTGVSATTLLNSDILDLGVMSPSSLVSVKGYTLREKGSHTRFSKGGLAGSPRIS